MHDGGLAGVELRREGGTGRRAGQAVRSGPLLLPLPVLPSHQPPPPGSWGSLPLRSLPGALPQCHYAPRHSLFKGRCSAPAPQEVSPLPSDNGAGRLSWGLCGGQCHRGTRPLLLAPQGSPPWGWRSSAWWSPLQAGSSSTAWTSAASAWRTCGPSSRSSPKTPSCSRGPSGEGGAGGRPGARSQSQDRRQGEAATG